MPKRTVRAKPAALRGLEERELELLDLQSPFQKVDIPQNEVFVAIFQGILMYFEGFGVFVLAHLGLT